MDHAMWLWIPVGMAVSRRLPKGVSASGRPRLRNMCGLKRSKPGLSMQEAACHALRPSKAKHGSVTSAKRPFHPSEPWPRTPAVHMGTAAWSNSMLWTKPAMPVPRHMPRAKDSLSTSEMPLSAYAPCKHAFLARTGVGSSQSSGPSTQDSWTMPAHCRDPRGRANAPQMEPAQSSRRLRL